MNEPPDRHKQNAISLQYDKTKTINNFSNISDPIYLLMSRTNPNETLAKISPFLIKKAIDSTCGEVIECKKLRSGEILIKTKNLLQANKLIKLTALSNTINIDIKPHNKLNTSKGVIYCNDLMGITEEEMLTELRSQNVIEVKKIYKKVNESLTETGLIIITFESSNLPTKLNVGYSKVDIRTYIPSPMRCNKCQRYNHTAKHCKNTDICFNCGLEHPIKDNEICFKPKNCANCTESKIKPSNHTAKDKKCPIFIKEQELLAIKTTYKIDNKAAKQIYDERHQHNLTTYASVISSQNSTTAPKTTTSLPTKAATSNTRDLISYEDSTEPQHITKETSTLKRTTVKILPKNTPKRLLNKIKKTSTKQTAPNNDIFNIQHHLDSSDEDAMDCNNAES